MYTFGRSLANRQTRASELPLMLNHGDDAYILSSNGIAPLVQGSLKTNAASFGEAKTSAARFISTPPRFQAALSFQKTFTP